jgi:hypothetical protein
MRKRPVKRSNEGPAPKKKPVMSALIKEPAYDQKGLDLDAAEKANKEYEQSSESQRKDKGTNKTTTPSTQKKPTVSTPSQQKKAVANQRTKIIAQKRPVRATATKRPVSRRTPKR